MLNVDDKVLADISKGFAIPARPELLLKLQELMADNEPSLTDIANAITKDVAMSATIIKTINSPLYGLARTISDIKKSVNYIGLQGIYSLVTSILLKREFSKGNEQVFDKFWHDAANIANAMVFIGKHIRAQSSAEKLFSIGLFHDCGIPVLTLKYDNYADVLTLAEKTPSKTLPEIEERIYQVNHATIGYYVASSWRLPKDICQLILSHHDRSFLTRIDNSVIQSEFAILKMAENIIHQIKYFTDHPDWPPLFESIFTVLNIDEDEYKDIVEDVSEMLAN
ncbi:MAG: HDOD domain-containing protein [Thalassotalea sp.]